MKWMVLREFHAVAATAFVLLQVRQQGAVAAAQVEHAGARRHQGGDGFDIDQTLAHAATSL